eukprot:CAMPEP_0184661756 /NCGR_PEP_ID=MMETSP0308-20130426/40014_1 /TAXON_ID=38269 /ORGANISM="Gloeochaete witrockiana, Strain SAG 46.84" /LENGTH=92 /DNA_ID=CAMNT_0027103285 /DNA_START=1231 /DNA_END=1509 /DNA_ORIENTATION=-
MHADKAEEVDGHNWIDRMRSAIFLPAGDYRQAIGVDVQKHYSEMPEETQAIKKTNVLKLAIFLGAAEESPSVSEWIETIYDTLCQHLKRIEK